MQKSRRFQQSTDWTRSKSESRPTSIRAVFLRRSVENYPGNQAALRRLSRSSQPIQCKLQVGAVNDPLEAEADRVADQVMRIQDTKPQMTGERAGGCPKCQSQPVPWIGDRKPLNGLRFILQCSPAVAAPGALAETQRTHFDDQNERSADRVIDAVSCSSHLDLARFAISPLSGPVRIQRKAILYIYFRRLRAHQMYDSFVRKAETFGLPVRFLKRVGREYTIDLGSSSEVDHWFNIMTLEEADLRSASQMAPVLPYGEASAIRTIYEESTHAYLDLVSNEPRFRSFIAAGERHYKGAATTGGRITTDPGRVFQEAAANYVAHRATTWWSTFKSLSIYISLASSDPAAAGRIAKMNLFAKLRDDYNKHMAEVVFGYSEEGGFLGFGSKQAETTRPMSTAMKTFLDHELLEDKIPDRFESVAGFQQLLRQARITLSSPAAAPGSAQTGAPAVQRQPTEQEHVASLDATRSVEPVLRSPGRLLDASARAYFEPRFGFDFSGVCVHTDEEAAKSAEELAALAYTIGSHVVFARSKYSPESTSGRLLLAHELTHVVQQRSGNTSSGLQAKLAVEGKEYSYSNKPVQWTLDHFEIGETGRAYLKSIIQSENRHEFETWGMLGYELRTKDKLAAAASETSRKIGFSSLEDRPRFRLDERYWQRLSEDVFQAKTEDYAKAFDAIFDDPSKNRLECKGLSQVMALRAFRLSVKDARFNWAIKRILGKERLTIPLNARLLAYEDLEATLDTSTYAGEKVFRPGDMVVFSATSIPESRGTLWQVENAIVVGWNDKGELLFAGGGLAKRYTEEEMKKEICRQIGVAETPENTIKIELFKDVSRLRISRTHSH